MTDGEDGFLTLEAIIALALAALVLSAFYQTASLAIQGRQAAAARQELLTLGQSLIERAGVDPSNPLDQQGQMSGTLWTLSSKPIGPAEPGRARLAVVAFDAKTSKGAPLLTLRTIKFVTGSR